MFDYNNNESNWAVTVTYLIAAIFLVPLSLVVLVYIAWGTMFIFGG
jgi:hypothetical protein